MSDVQQSVYELCVDILYMSYIMSMSIPSWVYISYILSLPSRVYMFHFELAI